jgi:positive regulator of sigma E activity
LQWRSGELASILGGLVGLLGGLLLAGAYTRRHQHDGSYQAMILRQLPDAQDKFA